MLQHLQIQNYALIDEVTLDFSDGLTVITGETGAGKSILLGALSLILGQRADGQVLLNKEKKCTVEATFQIGNLGLAGLFENEGLDYDDETILRRQINPNGKSRAFINDSPVSLTQMKALAGRLIDIHSQHDNLMLGRSDYQTALLDACAGNQALLHEYQQAYGELNEAIKVYQAFLSAVDPNQDEDYLRFQLNELEAAQLVEGEEEALEQEFELLSHAGEIKSRLVQVGDVLDGQEGNVNDQLYQATQVIGKLASRHPDVAAIAERLNSSLIELRDIGEAVSDLSDKVDVDPEREEEVARRLDMLRGLQQKHRVQSIGELTQIEDKFRQQLKDLTGREEQEALYKQAVSEKRTAAFGLACKLTENRQAAKGGLEQDVAALLSEMKMKDARLTIDITSGGDQALRETGRDAIRFLFAANKGGSPQELSRVASGGEMSRLMLALKSILSRGQQLPTLILDEIDTGISGDVADKAGHIMESMSAGMQVIAVTHLPQIASKGKQHLEVFKKTEGKVTQTRIRPLDVEGRVKAVAAMLSGAETTNAAVENAKTLLRVKS
ncbi:MAG: DNA repair protein RecN [Flavobacteriales bacterium]|nr:DNA repair protein RecN [Flavobacteriales bacterium]